MGPQLQPRGSGGCPWAQGQSSPAHRGRDGSKPPVEQVGVTTTRSGWPITRNFLFCFLFKRSHFIFPGGTKTIIYILKAITLLRDFYFSLSPVPHLSLRPLKGFLGWQNVVLNKKLSFIEIKKRQPPNPATTSRQTPFSNTQRYFCPRNRWALSSKWTQSCTVHIWYSNWPPSRGRGRYRQHGRCLCTARAPSSIGVEVAIASAVAISKIAISNGHCIAFFWRASQKYWEFLNSWYQFHYRLVDFFGWNWKWLPVC